MNKKKSYGLSKQKKCEPKNMSFLCAYTAPKLFRIWLYCLNKVIAIIVINNFAEDTNPKRPHHKAIFVKNVQETLLLYDFLPITFKWLTTTFFRHFWPNNKQ